MILMPFWAAGVINGLGHWWGYRNFDTADTATNLTPWGLLIGGEELHNNHHAFPSSAKFALRRFEFDIGWAVLWTLAKLRLAKILRVAPQARRPPEHQRAGRRDAEGGDGAPLAGGDRLLLHGAQAAPEVRGRGVAAPPAPRAAQRGPLARRRPARAHAGLGRGAPAAGAAAGVPPAPAGDRRDQERRGGGQDGRAARLVPRGRGLGHRRAGAVLRAPEGLRAGPRPDPRDPAVPREIADTFAHERAVHPVPTEFAAQARIRAAAYERDYAESVRDPDAFWGRVGATAAVVETFTRVKDTSFDAADFHIRWFADGELNASVNCLDRQLASAATRPRSSGRRTIRPNLRCTSAIANCMRACAGSPMRCTNLGVSKGDGSPSTCR